MYLETLKHSIAVISVKRSPNKEIEISELESEESDKISEELTTIIDRELMWVKIE